MKSSPVLALLGTAAVLCGAVASGTALATRMRPVSTATDRRVAVNEQPSAEPPASSVSTPMPSPPTDHTAAGVGALEPVEPCPLPSDALRAFPSTFGLAPIPSTYRLPAGIAHPGGMSVYGTGLVIDLGEPSLYQPDVVYGLAPTGLVCRPHFASADSGFAQTFDNRQTGLRAATIVFHAGGEGPSLMLSCPYITAAATDLMAQGWSASTVRTVCARRAGITAFSIPTGSEKFQLSAVIAAPGVVISDGIDQAAADRRDSTVALFTYGRGGGLASTCTLADAERDRCIAMLGFFLATQPGLDQSMSPAALTAALADVTRALQV